MSEIYNEEYYQKYRMADGVVSYNQSDELRRFMKWVASWVVENLKPKTVLDAGCAMGLLVEELRALGVEAYGVDISSYAVENADETVRPFLACGSIGETLPETLPERFDLIISMEVLEHIKESECLKAIKNLSGYTDTILFCSTPDDDGDPTHINLHPQNYWRDRFGEQGLFIEEIPVGGPMPKYSLLLLRKDPAKQAVQYLNEIDDLTKEKQDLNLRLLSQQILLQRGEDAKNQLETALDRADKEQKALREQYGALFGQFGQMQQAYNSMVSSASWRMTKPFRKTLDLLKRLLRRFRPLALAYKGVKSLIFVGPKATYYKIRDRHRRNKANKNPYGTYTEADFAAQRETKFPKDITFSILVPLYNTNKTFLAELIDSVKKQTYPKWQLCLADGSDSENGLAGFVEEYCKNDERILYNKLGENRGISGNTNAAIDLATGEYFSLLDHDDLLHPAALYENMKAICERGADFIYTDELTFEDRLDNVVLYHHKPDFAIDTLRSNNYICHFTTFKAALLEEVGLFRSECDGSQDYDMILRLTEKARSIVHIPRALYFWRSHKESAAQSIEAKPYVLAAARKALGDHLERVGLAGEVLDNEYVKSVYRIRYEINGMPLVSIIIPNKDHIADLEQCLRSIKEKTTYPNYEIIIVENNSTDPFTFAFYQTLQEDENIKVVYWKGPFNYPQINNYGAAYAKGDYYILLNNDTSIITPGWIEEMLMFAQRKDVGIVGVKLYYPDNTIQHGGVLLGLGGVAGHYFVGLPRGELGYMGRLIYAQNMTAVTAACMMLRKEVWDEIGGLDPEFAVAFNDIDLCMRVRQKGYLVVFTPYAELYHYESKSRGSDTAGPAYERFVGEVKLFQNRWQNELDKGDPYYNPNLRLEGGQISLR